MNILDGKKKSKAILADLARRVAQLDFVPVFVDVLVGDDPVSLQYIQMKEKRARDVGMDVHRITIPGSTTTEQLISSMQEALTDPRVCGAIVQLPLPEHIETQRVLDAIPPELDVDVLGSDAAKRFYSNTSLLSFPAAKAAYILLQGVPHEPRSTRVLVMGQGMLVGRPITHMLEKDGYIVTVATKDSPATRDMLQTADVIISATGVPHLIRAEDIKDGVVIIDAGTSESDGGVIGDVDVDAVKSKVSYIAPVPGGVGPMTVALLLENVVQTAEERS